MMLKRSPYNMYMYMHVHIVCVFIHTLQEADEQIVTAITALVKENVEVLVGSNRNAADGEGRGV